MLCFTRQDPRVLEELGDLSPLRLANPSPQPGRERLRHLVIGSPEGVRATINLLLRGDQRVTSAVFPNLNLTAKAILGVE